MIRGQVHLIWGLNIVKLGWFSPGPGTMGRSIKMIGPGVNDILFFVF